MLTNLAKNVSAKFYTKFIRVFLFFSLPDKPIYLITSFTFISNRNSSLHGSNTKNAKHLKSHPYRSPFGRFLSKTVLITKKCDSGHLSLYCIVMFQLTTTLKLYVRNLITVHSSVSLKKKIKLEKRKKGLLRKTLDLSPHPWNQ